jgi:hypothetical protein
LERTRMRGAAAAAAAGREQQQEQRHEHEQRWRWWQRGRVFFHRPAQPTLLPERSLSHFRGVSRLSGALLNS